MLAPNPAMPRPDPSQPGGGAAEPVPPKWHDVTVVTRSTYECARVEGVPPEEFGIARNARSIRDAGYVFHEVIRTQAELVDQGYDRDAVDKLPSYTAASTIEEQSRDTVEESQSGQGDDGMNRANRRIKVTEHYLRIDYEGDGKPRLYRVTTGGDDGVILARGGEPDVVEVDAIPFAAMTPVIVTHRFFGRSIADLVMDIQRIKTALLRALLDNAYLANNPRTEVAESHATETTLDDLLISRPGGIVRTKMPGGLQVIQHPDIGGHVFPLLQYQDATREWRTGVSRQGQGVDPNALQNQVATIANQMFNAAQAKTKLVARIFAETGIKDLFGLLHAVIRKHGSKAQTVRLRNQWVAVDPRDWKARNDLTINVGLGTGSKAEQLAQLQLLIGAQEKAIAAGLVSPKNLYNSAKELVRLTGHKDVDQFFTAPGTPPDPQDAAAAPIPPPPDPKLIELQAKNEIEKTQAQADIATQQKKVESEMALAQQKFELEKELKLLDAQIKMEEHRRSTIADAVKGLPAEAASAAEAGQPAPAGGTPGSSPPSAPLVAALLDTLQRMSAPKRAKKLPDGSWVTEHVGPN